jgi:hypothetical protein
LYLDQQSIDTTTPAGKLMLQITERLPPNGRNHFGVPTPESWSGCRDGARREPCNQERRMIADRTKAGFAAAKARGIKLGNAKLAVDN